MYLEKIKEINRNKKISSAHTHFRIKSDIDHVLGHQKIN